MATPTPTERQQCQHPQVERLGRAGELPEVWRCATCHRHLHSDHPKVTTTKKEAKMAEAKTLKLTGMTHLQLQALADEGYGLENRTASTAVLTTAPEGHVLPSYEQALYSVEGTLGVLSQRRGTWYQAAEAASTEQTMVSPNRYMASTVKGHRTALQSVVRKLKKLTTEEMTNDKESKMTTTKTTTKKAPAKKATTASAKKAPAKKAPAAKAGQPHPKHLNKVTSTAHETGGKVTSTRHQPDAAQRPTWTLQCEHGTKHVVGTVAQLKAERATPSAWCGQCKKAAAARKAA